MKKIIIVLIFIAIMFFMYVGGVFDRDRALDLNYRGELVEVEVKLPNRLVPKEMEVTYRSSSCSKTTYSANGKIGSVDGFNGLDMELKFDEASASFKGAVPVDGGGSCDWHLSNIALGVKYLDMSDFGENVVFVGGAGLVIIFDDNRARRAIGFPISNNGDLYVIESYYPWYHENFTGAKNKYLSLVSDGHDYFSYDSPDARKVYFEPVVHFDLVARSNSLDQEVDGKEVWYTYPDGSFEFINLRRPSFYKLEAIRKKIEAGATTSAEAL